MSPCKARATTALIAALALLAASGCGDTGYKQVRIESGAIGSSASEAAELADQRLRGRVPRAFTRVQAQTLSEQFGKTLQSLATTPAEPDVRALANEAAELAHEGQQQAQLIQAGVNNDEQLRAAKNKLSAIGEDAGDLESEAESREARE